MIRTALIALLAATPALGQDQASSEPLARFGAIADPQYAPARPRGSRYYANSLWKLSEAVEALNEEDLDFVVTLGDVIDRHVDAYNHILPIYNDLEAENWFVLGNHEYDVADDYVDTVPAFLGMDERYYDFAVNGVRFVVIDGNDLSLFANLEGSPRREASEAMLADLEAEGAVNAKTWNGGLSDEQITWLRGRLDAAREAGEQVVVFGHYPMAPEDMHNLWNYEAVTDVLAEYDNVMAYLNGHNHAGHYAEEDGIHYVTVEGMVETAAETAYAIVEVYPDRVVIDGFGRVTDRELEVASE